MEKSSPFIVDNEFNPFPIDSVEVIDLDILLLNDAMLLLLIRGQLKVFLNLYSLHFAVD